MNQPLYKLPNHRRHQPSNTSSSNTTPFAVPQVPQGPQQRNFNFQYRHDRGLQARKQVLFPGPSQRRISRMTPAPTKYIPAKIFHSSPSSTFPKPAPPKRANDYHLLAGPSKLAAQAKPPVRQRYHAPKSASMFRRRAQEVQTVPPSFMLPGMKVVRKEGLVRMPSPRFQGRATRPIQSKVSASHRVLLYPSKSAARKSRAIHEPLPEEEESSEEKTEEEEEIDELQTTSESEHEMEITHEGSLAARLLQSIPDPRTLSSSVSPAISPRPSQAPAEEQPAKSPTPDPLNKLFISLKLYSLPSILLHEARQLPFLVRNLRRGFQSRCLSLNIPITPLPNDHEVEGPFLVRYEHVANAMYERNFEKWQCPLCDLFGTLSTREMLQFHLDQDHKDIFIEWILQTPNEDNTQQQYSWSLHILIPELTITTTTNEDSDKPDLDSYIPSQSVHHPHILTTTPAELSPTLSDLTPLSSSPIISNDPADLFPSASPRRPSIPTTSTSTPSIRLPRPIPLPSLRFSHPTQTFPTHHHLPRPPQYPRPAPSTNRRGPAARQPYLPMKSTFGGPDVYYSTRPGGPYLFDLLQLLPLEPFGTLSWLVLDREEEMYLCDEVPDELKVIQALWSRWIMLNRNTFIANHLQGTKMFINEYWRMIHLAAGWDALFHQLMVLAANLYLGSQDVPHLLGHYESLTGMKFWDQWDSDEE
ncbi:hypothetical protein AMATHDRAFT_85750 [Amanita thiersii Skay4041]|uniref:Uncharacterized protein n=1 Tax=Amanita thiersii Skay4041 TaxID=703135 RepID=A0A2A9NS66_9AGAR|nr:hypothetical protein AMATHDRAFT_85750 [Amanita thiersii Skay4041]